MSEFKIAICDDERIEQLLLSRFLMKYVPEAQLCYFPDGKSLLADFHEGQYQAIFMDIYMRDMNGITVVQQIRRTDAKVPVAFTTSSTDHADDSRMVGATGYLTKPLQEEEVRQFLQKVQQMRNGLNNPGIKLLVSGQETEIPLDQILYLEKKMFAGASVHLRDGSVLKCDRMPQLTAGVSAADHDEAAFELTDGSRISIQKNYRHSAMEAYDRYIFDQMRGQS